MKIIAISDTHNRHDNLDIPDGDVLIHCGDFSTRGTIQELVKFNYWLGTLPHKYKLCVPGNHDFICEQCPELARQELTNATLLIDRGIELEGKKFYGTPWTPTFGPFAFMREDSELDLIFSMIPEGLDVLISHGPPKRILDKTVSGVYAGSESLSKHHKRALPHYTIFGHIHEGYGSMDFIYHDQFKRGDKVNNFRNVSICDAHYKPVNSPVTFEI